jgi:hypothetical protein
VKRLSLLFFLSGLLIGCAHRPTTVWDDSRPVLKSSEEPAVPNMAPWTNKMSTVAAEKIWNERAAIPPQGIRNQGIIRAIKRGSGFIWKENVWRKAQVGSILSEGDVVQTGPDTLVEVFLVGNGPMLRLLSETTLRIVRLREFDTGIEKRFDTMLELHTGWLVGTVRKLGYGSSYMVRCQTGVGVVTGTIFKLSEYGEAYVLSGTMVLHAGELTRNAETNEKKFQPDELDVLTIGITVEP